MHRDETRCTVILPTSDHSGIECEREKDHEGPHRAAVEW